MKLNSNLAPNIKLSKKQIKEIKLEEKNRKKEERELNRGIKTFSFDGKEYKARTIEKALHKHHIHLNKSMQSGELRD